MKKVILPIFIIIVLISCGHKLNSKVEKSIVEISKEDCVILDFEFQNEAFKNLLKVSSIEDLVYLTENEHSYVKYYAFIGLREKNYSKILEIYNAHKHDNETINTSNGACLTENTKIGELMLWALNPENPKYKWLSKTEYDKLYKEQFK